MHPYKNPKDNSGVIAYEIGDDYIIAQFQDGSAYLYNYKCAGKGNIEKMKTLAVAGEGLTTFINQVVKDRYAKKVHSP